MLKIINIPESRSCVSERQDGHIHCGIDLVVRLFGCLTWWLRMEGAQRSRLIT
jgi:hypothetical protein